MSECKRCEASFESTPDRAGALCVACHLAGESAIALWMEYCDQKEELSRLREQNAELAQDAARYRYFRDRYEWRRHGGTLADEGSHAFIGVRFPYLANFDCKAMLDYNIDKMMENEDE